HLADSVGVRYRQPLLLGSTACLDLIRPARTVPWCDGILLMGETLILGQSPAAHIMCHELSKGLVLVNRQGDLTVQTSRWIDVDGRRVRGSVRIGLGSRLVCDDVSVTFEAHQ
ncbi:MAG TPA: hypothetical protein PKD54_10325, partial [Pirellulaceae bacterium]|nr:hypothetical protein [Pirellulaceae bacterium]